MAPRAKSPGGPVAGGLLSIGALSAATGIPVDTIRTWERRYGFPVADRKPSGHRVYPLSTVPRLRRVAQAILRGHRAAEVVSASETSLEALVASLPPPSESETQSLPHRTGESADQAGLLAAVSAFDPERLRRGFQVGWAGFGPLEFLMQRAVPFLAALGTGWAEGSLDVRHEHFGSSVLGDFLRAVRLPLDDRARGPVVALATLPGELHGLGLQMSALVFAMAGWRVLILGVETPVAQIAALAREAPIAAVALSCVQPRSRATTGWVRSLRGRLPRSIPLIIGGSGAPSVRLRGIEIMSDLPALDQWLRTRPPV